MSQILVVDKIGIIGLFHHMCMKNFVHVHQDKIVKSQINIEDIDHKPTYTILARKENIGFLEKDHKNKKRLKNNRKGCKHKKAKNGSK